MYKQCNQLNNQTTLTFFLLMNIMSHVTIIIMQEDIISQVGKRFKDERLKEKVMKYVLYARNEF